jgi:SMC interacting uncharacterized protein involved in chromosome segregation
MIHVKSKKKVGIRMKSKNNFNFTIDDLPSDWKEKITEMQSFFEMINNEGSVIPKKYNMTKQQYEMYIQNPSNFNEDVWSEIQEVKQKMDTFISDMRTALEIAPSKLSERKKRLNQQKSWIRVS